MNVLCSILYFVKCWDLHLKCIKSWNVSIIYTWLNSNTRGHIVYDIRMSMASGNQTLNQMDHLSTQGEVPRAHQDDVRSIADVASTSSQELQSVTRHTLAVVGLAAADNASDQLLSESQCRTPSAESSNRSCVVDIGPSKTVLSIFESWMHMANYFHYRAINFFMALLSCYEFQILRKLFKSTECFVHLTDHSSFKSMFIYRRKYLECKTNYFLFAWNAAWPAREDSKGNKGFDSTSSDNTTSATFWWNWNCSDKCRDSNGQVFTQSIWTTIINSEFRK